MDPGLPAKVVTLKTSWNYKDDLKLLKLWRSFGWIKSSACKRFFLILWIIQWFGSQRNKFTVKLNSINSVQSSLILCGWYNAKTWIEYKLLTANWLGPISNRNYAQLFSNRAEWLQSSRNCAQVKSTCVGNLMSDIKVRIKLL